MLVRSCVTERREDVVRAKLLALALVAATGSCALEFLARVVVGKRVESTVEVIDAVV